MWKRLRYILLVIVLCVSYCFGISNPVNAVTLGNFVTYDDNYTLPYSSTHGQGGMPSGTFSFYENQYFPSTTKQSDQWYICFNESSLSSVEGITDKKYFSAGFAVQFQEGITLFSTPMSARSSFVHIKSDTVTVSNTIQASSNSNFTTYIHNMYGYFDAGATNLSQLCFQGDIIYAAAFYDATNIGDSGYFTVTPLRLGFYDDEFSAISASQEATTDAVNNPEYIQQEKQDLQDAKDDAESSAEDASDDAETETQSLTQAIGSIIDVFKNAQPTNCRIPFNLGRGFNGGEIDLCNTPNEVKTVIQTILAIPITLAVLHIAHSMLMLYLNTVREEQK